MVEGKERRGWERQTGAGSGVEGGRGCSHDSITPSFTVSQRIKCQTNQSSTKQTPITRGHDGIYLPRVHINKIKKYIIQNWLSPNNLLLHPRREASLSSPSFVLFLSPSSVCLLSLSPRSLVFVLPLCLLQLFHCAWLMSSRQGLEAPCSSSSSHFRGRVVCLSFLFLDNVAQGKYPAAMLTSHPQKHPHIHTDGALIWHWIITDLDPEWPF